MTNAPQSTIQTQSPAPSPAFVVAKGVKGTAHTFQVYLDRQKIYFIRVGMGPGVEYGGAAAGGLIGALLMLFISSYRKKSQQRREAENREKSLSEMLQNHKANHAIALADIASMSLDPGNWAMKKGTVIWRGQVRGEKKPWMAAFRTPEDVAAAFDLLPRFFPQTAVNVHPDPKSGRFLKNG